MKMRGMRRVVALCLVGSLLSLAGCASRSTVDAMITHMKEQDRKIASLSNMQPAQADTWAQVQQLREEMSSVQGQIDNFNHTTKNVGSLEELAAKVARHEQALRMLETQFATDLRLGGNAAPQGAAPVAPAPQVSPAVPAAVAAAPVAAAAAAQTPAPAAQPKDVAKALYDTAMGNYNSRNFRAALTGFTDFVSTYPKHSLTGNAQFWKAESHFALGQYSNAALDYQAVIDSYPKHSKVAACYLKQGLSFQKMGQKDAAKMRLQDVINKFPKSPEASRARQQLQSLK